MKRVVLLVLLVSAVASAYCEIGSEKRRELVQGGTYVIYGFSNGREIGIKYKYGESAPYTVRFNFFSMEWCN